MSSSSRAPLKAPSNTLDRININKLQKLDFGNFSVIDHDEIKRIDERRDYIERSSKEVLYIFEKMICKDRKLPTDKALSKVIVALTNLNQENAAIELFNLFQQKICNEKQGKVVGLYTCDAVLKALSSSIEEKIQIAKEIWSLYQEKGCIDDYLLGSMMRIYSAYKSPKESKQLFERYKDKEWITLQTHNSYVFALIDLNELETAEKYIDNLIIKIYQKEKNNSDRIPIQNVFSHLISSYVESGSLPKALCVFEKAMKYGFYENNKLDIDNADKARNAFPRKRFFIEGQRYSSQSRPSDKKDESEHSSKSNTL